MHRSAFPVSLIVVTCLLAACAAASNGDQTADVGTSTPTPAPTRTPRPTITPTLAPSATPDVALYDDGAWLLFLGSIPDSGERNSHLWAVNWDGTGLTDLLPHFFVWQYMVQPTVDGSPGRYVAAITSHGWSDKFMFTLTHLPDGEIVANIPLTNSQTELIDFVPFGDPDYEDYNRRMVASMSISDLRSVAWSPDGTRIAFSGAQNGTQTDIYVYSLKDGSVSRLTRGQHPHHASNLLWSSDGQYIAYDDVSDFLTSFYWWDGIWVVRTDGSRVRQIASEEEWPPTGNWPTRAWRNRPQKLGWISDHTIAVYALMTLGDNYYRLKQIDVDTGRSSTVVKGEYCGAAFAPEKNIWFIEIPPTPDDPHTSGAYLLQNGTMRKVGPLLCWPRWSPDLNAFITIGGLVSADGEQMMSDLPGGFPLVSPDGAYWAYPDLWIGEIGKQPRQISDAPLEVLQWSSDSRSVLVTDTEEGLQYVAIAPDFELRLISRYNTSQLLGPWLNGLHVGD